MGDRQSTRRLGRWHLRVLAVGMALALVLAACGNSDDDGETSDTTSGGGGGGDNPTVDQPGVTDTEIRVGGLASITNPVGGNYGAIFDGTKAYFDMVNSEGGIYGRQLELVAERDDKLAQNQAEIQSLLSQDQVFAVLPIASLLFTGAGTLEDAGVPGFGWNINPEWTGRDNLFGNQGALCLGCDGQFLPWLAEQLEADKVAIYAYGTSEQSKLCAKGIRDSFERYQTAEVVAFDDSLPFGQGGPTDSQVQEAADKGAKLFTTCTDANATLQLGEKLKKLNVDAVQYMPNAYDLDFVQENIDVFEGSYTAPQFIPFETRPEPEGLKQYNKWMEENDFEKNEISMIGWIAAATFVEGLRLAGPEFTRQKVIDELNQLTNWTADGLLPGVDWTIQHEDPVNDESVRPDESCQSVLEITRDGFEIVFAPKDKPFVCFPKQEGNTLPEPTFRA